MAVRNGSLTHKYLFLVFSHQTMLHYRSSLLQTMSTLLFSPLLLTGVSEQKQLIEVELFPDFKSDLVSSSMNKTDRIVSFKFLDKSHVLYSSVLHSTNLPLVLWSRFSLAGSRFILPSSGSMPTSLALGIWLYQFIWLFMFHQMMLLPYHPVTFFPLATDTSCIISLWCLQLLGWRVTSPSSVSLCSSVTCSSSGEGFIHLSRSEWG